VLKGAAAACSRWASNFASPRGRAFFFPPPWPAGALADGTVRAKTRRVYPRGSPIRPRTVAARARGNAAAAILNSSASNAVAKMVFPVPSSLAT
jgi:hypothetical protein